MAEHWYRVAMGHDFTQDNRRSRSDLPSRRCKLMDLFVFIKLNNVDVLDAVFIRSKISQDFPINMTRVMSCLLKFNSGDNLRIGMT